METTVDSRRAPDRTAMEMFSGGGMAILPWTKQMLGVLWENLRLLVQIIYYTCMSVFQMFRFEVHVRITDENGQRVQHMSTATNPTESFLFSSLFDGDNGVMVGGSNPLSSFCADGSDPFVGASSAEALLSSLRADELCCGLVDDFVSRTAKDDGIFLGHTPSWKMGFPGDWNIFVSSTDSSGKSGSCYKSTDKVFEFKRDISEEEKSTHWSSEEDQTMGDFDSEENKALWESLSRSNDPYNPFFFSACISTNTNMGKPESDIMDTFECTSLSKSDEDISSPHGLNFWSTRSDSESSWGSSDSSSTDLDKEESERLWEFFSSPMDPYNPMCFTACTVSTAPQIPEAIHRSQDTQQSSLPAPYSSDNDTEEKESSFAPSASEEDEEEEQLWKSLCQNEDPYHPLNFQACIQTSPITTHPPKLQSRGDPDIPSAELDQTSHSLNEESKGEDGKWKYTRSTKPVWKQRHLKSHCHPDTIRVPWKKAKQPSGPVSDESTESKTSTAQKKVRFSPTVEVHVMRTWRFARQASRKGQWEEMARDRERFRRRTQETEKAIGHCFSLSHREKIRAYLDRVSGSARPSSA